MEHYRITVDDLKMPMQVMENVAPYGDIVMTLNQFSRSHETIPVSTAWYLTHLAEARGKQELYISKSAYIEFEERVGRMKGPRGAKTTLVRDTITRMQDRFMVKDVEQACPGVSREMVRYVLRQMKSEGMVECLGRGPGAQWIKKGNSS